MPTARGGLATVTGSDGRIYAIGGVAAGGAGLNTVEAFTPTTNSWATVAPMPTARGYLAAALGADGRIYAMGGLTGNAFSNEVDAYTPSTNSWTQVAPMPTPRSELATATGTDGRIYAVGGYNGTSLNTVEAYTPATNTWSSVTPMALNRRGPAAAAGPDGRIYVIGGYNGSWLSAVEAYQPSTNQWSPAGSLAAGRDGLAATTGPDGRIYALGGVGAAAVALATVEAYSVAANSWTLVAPMPTARIGLGAATGSDGAVYAVGGGTATGPLATVEAYDIGTVSDVDLGLSGMPGNITVYAASAAGSVVTYSAPTATDEPGDMQAPTAVCDHPTGSIFAITTTTVTCTATDPDDSPSSVSRTFTVSVVPDVQLGAWVSPESATTGTVLTGGVSTTNEGVVKRTVTVKATLSYVTASLRVKTVARYKGTITLGVGQTTTRSSNYTVTADTPRGSYVLEVTASDVTGSVTSVAYFTIS